MYRGYFIDAAGRKRERMGFYGLSKPNLHKCDDMVLVEARDKKSAANKINKKYHINITPSNLRQVPLSVGKICKSMGVV